MVANFENGPKTNFKRFSVSLSAGLLLSFLTRKFTWYVAFPYHFYHYLVNALSLF